MTCRKDSIIGRKLFSLGSLMKTLGHSVKLDEKRFNHKRRKVYFTVRVVRMWNSLPQSVVAEGNVAIIKNP